jgi:hypothetical protein
VPQPVRSVTAPGTAGVSAFPMRRRCCTGRAALCTRPRPVARCRVIGDERAAASLLGDDDAVLAVSLSRYTDHERWVADVVGSARRPRPRDQPRAGDVLARPV